MSVLQIQIAVMSLPSLKENQSYWDVSVLEAGFITIPREWVISNATKGERRKLPAFSFLLRHSKTAQTVVFDLGIRKNWRETFPPAAPKRLEQMTFEVDVPQDAQTSLVKGGLSPEDVQNVCISHMHFDHIGDPSPFTNATFVLGEGSRTLLANGYPIDPDSNIPADLVPLERTQFVSPDDPTWGPIGPFPKALDWLGDGSLYIVDAPGHVTGHVNFLTRTSNDGGWVYLAGDSAHDRKLLSGEASIPKHCIFGCAHRDVEAAVTHIGNIRKLMENERVRVLLAHDVEFYEESDAASAYFPGKLQSM